MEGRPHASTGLLDPCRAPSGVRAHEEPKGARRDRVRVGRPPEGRLEDGSGSTPGTPGRFRRGRPEAATAEQGPELLNRTQSDRDRVARYPQILGGTVAASATHGPRHAFLGDLSELSAGGSSSELGKRTSPASERVPSIGFGAPSPGLPLVHCGGAGRQRASRPSHGPYSPELARRFRAVEAPLTCEREHEAERLARDRHQDLLRRGG